VPIGYWRLDDPAGSAAADSSGLGNDGAYEGSPIHFASGALATDADKAVYFHGRPLGSSATPVDDVWAPVAGGPPSGAAPATVEAWIKPGSFYANFEPVVGWHPSLRGFFWNLGLLPSSSTSAKLQLNGSSAISTTTLAPNHWYFIAASDDGTTQQLYVNGKPAGTFTGTTTKPTASAVDISYEPSGNPLLGGLWFNGSIDDVAVYDSILGPDDIAGQYAAAASGTSGAGCEDIAGATEQSYALTQADAGASVRAEVTAYNDIDGIAWADSAPAVSAGTARALPPPPVQAAGPVIDQGTVTDAAGDPIAGARVALYPHLATHGVVRPGALATATTDAGGVYQITLPDAGAVAALADANGWIGLTREVLANGADTSAAVERTYDDVNGVWLDEDGSVAPATTVVDPASEATTMLARPIPAAGFCLQLTVATGRPVMGETTIAELHAWADTTVTFTYGRTADSTIGVGYSRNGSTGWSLSGSQHVSNNASARSPSYGPAYGKVERGQFNYQKYKILNTCSGITYKVAPTVWTGGIDNGGANVAAADGHCLDSDYAGKRASWDGGSGAAFDTTREKAATYGAAVTVFGAQLSARSGFSSNVHIHWHFVTPGVTHWLCGSNNVPALAAIVYAGPNT
jgi:Concanavalin A-like lectin/glucanases superfamily